jgi:hypothetical protein
VSTQSSFGVTAGNDITEAWGDNVGAHLLTTETATPSTVFEGKEWVRTDRDAVMRYTGSAAEEYDGYGDWETYVPQMFGSSYGLFDASKIGNGVLAGAFRYVAGRTVTFWASFTYGTTSNISSPDGVMALEVPRAMSTSAQAVSGVTMRGQFSDSSGGGATYRLVCGVRASTSIYVYLENTTLVSPYVLGGAGLAWGTPVGFGVGDSWVIAGTYESTS